MKLWKVAIAYILKGSNTEQINILQDYQVNLSPNQLR